MLWRTAFFALGMALATAPNCAVAQPVLRREVTFSAGGLALVPSAYGDAVEAFGRPRPTWGVQLDTQVFVVRGPSWSLGPRFGWSGWWLDWRDIERCQPSFPLHDGTMSIQLFDLGGVARYIAYDTRRPRGTRIHFDFEGSFVLGAITVARVTQMVVAPRVGVSAFVGWRIDHGLIGFRLGGQYVPWDGGGGSPWDPAFGGVFLGLAGGWSR